MIPRISLVGRPNVGKSSLFNRILNRRIAIVHQEAGITRDTIEATVSWNKKTFLLTDTGGLNYSTEERIRDGLDNAVRSQLLDAIESAEKIIFVGDASAEIMPMDQEVADYLRKSNKKTILAINKVDHHSLEDRMFPWMRLGFQPIIPISCIHNINIDLLLDAATEDFPELQDGDHRDQDRDVPKIAIIGRPNVGKSSIVNRFLQENRVIVSDKPGTTRDAIEARLSFSSAGLQGEFDLVDTAGIRKKKTFKSAVDHFSILRAGEAIKKADVALLVIDANVGVTAMDKTICRIANQAYKPCIIVANKWDIACRTMKQKDLLQEIRYSLPALAFSPALVSSAISGYNFPEIISHLVSIHQQLSLTISTSKVNATIQDIKKTYQTLQQGGKVFKMYYGVFIKNRPPTFLLFVNRKKNFPANHMVKIKKILSAKLGLKGLPIQIILRNRREATVGRR